MVDYKLRLGDGTTFSVDEKGLTTWLQGGLVDDKARVQPAGSKKWFTLKQVLAAQGEQRGHAVRKTEKGRADVDRQAAEETAAIERRVAEQRASEERKAGDDLAAAERKAAEDRNAAERKLIEEREAAERYLAEEAAEAEARAAEEKRVVAERLEAERRAAEEKAAAERTEAETREAERVAEAERQVAAERAERAERKRKADEARAETERQAAETARLEAEAREVAARDAAARAQVEAERVAEAERKVAAERAERAERKRRADVEKAAAEKAAAEKAAAEAAAKIAAARVATEKAAAEKVAAAKALAERAAAERLAEERLAAERLAADRLAAQRQAAEREAAIEPFHVAGSEPSMTAIPIEPAAEMVKVEDFERELALVPVGFDDSSARTAPAGGGVAAPMREAGAGDAPPPAIPETPAAIVKTLIRFSQVAERAVTRVAGMFRRAAPVNPAAVEVPIEMTPVAPPPAASVVLAPPAAPPAARTTPSAPAPSTSALPPWAAPPPAPWSPSAVKSVGAATTPREAPRAPVMPPPGFKDVATIPFATATAPPAGKPAEEMWDGEDEVWEEPSRVSSTLAGVWRWTVRGLVLTALVGAAAVAALNREKWIPQAQDAANTLGQNVDKLSEAASTRTVSPQAIEAARAQIPYLRAQTLELVLLTSPSALEPAEVFRRAHLAAERGRPSLPTHVAAEIDNLIGAAAAALDDGERERLTGYFALLRAGTTTAAYQDKDAIWLMSRGARRLTGEQQSRMEQVFGDAIAAGLAPSPAP
jgi:hypothetical protein